jgi:hypothetical protein
VHALIDTLAEQLERPKEVPSRLVDHVWSTYEIDRDAVGEFLVTRLPDLEDYEHELILSPLYTPKLTDQALSAELLGQASVAETEWSGIVQQLESRPTTGSILTSDGKIYKVPLREVVLERYIRLLRLNGSIPDAVWVLLQQEAFAEERTLFKAIARRAIWERAPRAAILKAFLEWSQDTYLAGDGLRLLSVAEDHRPKDVAYLVKRLPQWQEALRKEIEAADDPKPFFVEQIRDSHGFERDQRQREEDRITEKQDELVFLSRLQEALKRRY